MPDLAKIAEELAAARQLGPETDDDDLAFWLEVRDREAGLEEADYLEFDHPRNRLGRWVRKLGLPMFEVGGAVRDPLLGKEPKDVDFMALATPEEIKSAVEATGAKAEELRVRDRLVGIRAYGDEIPDGGVEIAPPRIEVSTGPGRKDFEIVPHPDASNPAVIPKDAERRDFTLNALYRDPETGEVLDPTGKGRDDLENRLLRTTHEDSFRDDPLRILRGARFAAQHGLDVEPETYAQMVKHADAMTALTDKGVSGTVQDEMNKLLMSDKPSRGLRLLRDTGALAHLFPELAPMIGFDQESKYHDLTVDEHIFAVVDGVAAAGGSLTARMAALFHDSGKPAAAWRGPDGRLHYYANPKYGKRDHAEYGAEIAQKALTRINYPTDMKRAVVQIIENHMLPEAAKPRPIKARRLRARLPAAVLDDLMIHRMADFGGKGEDDDEEAIAGVETLAQMIKDEGDAPVHRSDLMITGNDLRDAGIPPGPEMGRVLNDLLNQVIGQPSLNTREWLLRQARKAGRKIDEPESRGLKHGVAFGEMKGLQTTTRVYVAFHADPGYAEPVGVLSVDDKTNTVELVYVPEDFRGQGIGARLLEVARADTGLSLDRDTGERSALGARWAKRRGVTAGRTLRELPEREAVGLGARLMHGITSAQLHPGSGGLEWVQKRFDAPTVDDPESPGLLSSNRRRELNIKLAQALDGWIDLETGLRLVSNSGLGTRATFDVMNRDGNVVGEVWRRVMQHGVIERLSTEIDEEYQRKGFASRLLAREREIGRELGLRGMESSFVSFKSRGFGEKTGFEIVPGMANRFVLEPLSPPMNALPPRSVEDVDEMTKALEFQHGDMKLEWPEAFTESMFDDGQQHVIKFSAPIVTTDGENVGYMERWLYPEGDEAYFGVKEPFVYRAATNIDEEHRGTGFGTEMLRLESDLYERNGIKVILVEPGSDSALRFAAKSGFEPMQDDPGLQLWQRRVGEPAAANWMLDKSMRRLETLRAREPSEEVKADIERMERQVARLREPESPPSLADNGWDTGIFFHVTQRDPEHGFIHPRTEGSTFAFPTEPDAVYLWPTLGAAEQHIEYLKRAQGAGRAEEGTPRIVEVHADVAWLEPDPEPFYNVLRNFQADLNRTPAKHELGWEALDEARHWPDPVNQPEGETLREYLWRIGARVWSAKTPSDETPANIARDPWIEARDVLGEMPPSLKRDVARVFSEQELAVLSRGPRPVAEPQSPEVVLDLDTSGPASSEYIERWPAARTATGALKQFRRMKDENLIKLYLELDENNADREAFNAVRKVLEEREVPRPPPYTSYGQTVGTLLESESKVKLIQEAVATLSDAVSRVHAVPFVSDGMRPGRVISLANRELNGDYEPSRSSYDDDRYRLHMNSTFPAFVLAHELGHGLDYRALSKRFGGASVGWLGSGHKIASQRAANIVADRAGDPDADHFSGEDDAMIRLFETIRGTFEWERIRQWETAEVGTSHDQHRFASYMNRPTELFARAYAQWIAVRSNDEVLLEQMERERRRRERRGGPQPYWFWDGPNEQAILKAMDELAEEAGWLNAAW